MTRTLIPFALIRLGMTWTSRSSSPSLISSSSFSSSSISRYEEAVQRLNLLQSNSLTLQKLKDRRELCAMNVPETIDCLRRADITVDSLDSLRVIHVTGTKGKGSTCAYVETILREAGLKTGFFSSPHMVHVRERIRLNGQPMEEEHFADSLFSLYHKLTTNPPSQSLPPMPAYFKFLTILAFDVFLRMKVDVAIIEVGIGGEYDCTNVLRNPVVCGVTTLDYDHLSILGNTLTEIAWNKAGIFKKGAITIVSSDHDEEVMKVMRERAEEREVSSFCHCPLLHSYSLSPSVMSSGGLKVGIAGEHQKTNVSLALQLSRSWLRKERPQLEREVFGEGEWQPGETFEISSRVAKSVACCEWPGRSQILHARGCTFYLDGAHTVKSVQSCVKWFMDARQSSTLSKNRKCVLLFHCTGDRNPETLLLLLKSLPFDFVIFSPPLLLPRPSSSDAANFYRPPDEQTRQSIKCEEDWIRLRPEMRDGRVKRVDCVEEALSELDGEMDVLVTGSLILVGNVLSALGEK